MNPVLYQIFPVNFNSKELNQLDPYIDGLNTPKSNLVNEFDNISHRFIFLYSFPLNPIDNASLFTSFEFFGGIIEEEQWEYTSGFAGTINNSQTHLGEFISLYPPQYYEIDPIIQAQMNTIQDQINIYPDLYPLLEPDFRGTQNASIAVLDSGIDYTHNMFNASFEKLNFSEKIIGWNDLIANNSEPYDDNGHGTAISSIISASDNKALSSNHSGDSFYLTVGKSFNHYNLFYPHHISDRWYRVKLASFTMNSNALDQLIIHSNLIIASPLKEYQLELYRNGEIIDEASGSNLDLIWDTSGAFDGSRKSGEYDLVFSYRKTLTQNPIFSIQSNITFTPIGYPKDISEFSGIAPDARISSYKVLDQTGKGNLSTLITALNLIIPALSDEHIISLLLALASYDISTQLRNIITNLVDVIISNGCMVVIAAGNTGVDNNINSLAFHPQAIVVGAINNLDELTYYSAQGKAGENEISPSIVAPGGSHLIDHEMVILPDSNQFDDQGSLQDKISNDLTTMSGTSISASVVAGIYNIIVDFLGGWEYWQSQSNPLKEALKIKNYLLLTASETNLLREDDPYTPNNEEDSSPILNRGTSDRYEGYGRINPDAIINMLNNSLELNQSYDIELSASNSEAMDTHVFAINITLEKGQLYQFNLNNEEGIFSTFDADMYLYNKTGDVNGNPVLIASSTQPGNTDDIIYFTNLNQTDTFYLVIKAISGSGTISLNVSKKELNAYPVLSNLSVNVISDLNYNDTLDTFNFEVNYTQNDNAPATFIQMIFPEYGKNFTLDHTFAFDNNYEDGSLYDTDIKFDQSGNFSYYFIAQIGNLTTIYNNSQSFFQVINPIHNYVGNNFTLTKPINTSVWDLDFESYQATIFGESKEVRYGWQSVLINNLDEDRSLTTQSSSWNSFYFGTTQEIENNSTIFHLNNNPFYSYENISGEYILYSPIVYVKNESSEFYQNFLSIGLRLSLSVNDVLEIEINSNRSGWNSIDSFTSEEFDWTLLRYNLSEYQQNYIQMRFRISCESENYSYKKGVFLDKFEIIQESDPNQENIHSPFLSQAKNSLNSTIPFYSSTGNTELDEFSFNIGYWDEDNNYPEFVYLELNHTNYTLFNVQGIWETGEYNENSTNQILYSAHISIFNIANKSFRFHCSDSNFTYSTDWMGITNLNAPEAIPFPFNSESTEFNPLRIGYPNNSTFTRWTDSSQGWHTLQTISGTYNNTEWYCGRGDLLGYDQNYKSALITPLLSLNGTSEIFLYLNHRLRFDSEGEDSNDFAEILYSENLGETWNSLIIFDKETEGVNFEDIKIDLTDLIGKNIILQFRFTSDENGEVLQRSGWRIKLFQIDIDPNKDYISPIITFVNLQDGDVIEGNFNLTIQIYDDSPIVQDRIEFWFDNEQLPVEAINNTINFMINSRNYKNNVPIEVIVVVYDSEGNRGFEKISISIKNPPTTGQYVLYISLALIGLFGISFLIARNFKIQKLKESGDYIRQPNFIEKRQARKFEKQNMTEEVNTIINNLNKDWEKAQPVKLTCKNCDKMYLSPEFELYCPSCHKPSLYVSKYCPVCKKWNYFEEASLANRCKKCNLILVKDFENAKEEIISHQNEIEKVDLSPEDRNTIFNLTQELRDEELEELIEEIRTKSKEGDMI